MKNKITHIIVPAEKVQGVEGYGIHMYYDAITGLPLKETFVSYGDQLLHSEDTDHYAILATKLSHDYQATNFDNKKHGSFLLSCVVQKFIRTHNYFLTAFRDKNDVFVILLDTYLLNEKSVDESILSAFDEFIQYTASVFPQLSLKMAGGICMYKNASSLDEAMRQATNALQIISDSKEQTALLHYENAKEHYHSLENRIVPMFANTWTNNHILIYLQPRFHGLTKEICGAEALVRIMDQNAKTLSPKEFLPVFEKYRVTYELDLVVTEQILKLLTKWQNLGIELHPISINISKEAILSPDFLSIFYQLIDKYPTVYQFLELEIDGEVLLSDHQSLNEQIHALYMLGCHIYLDNFSDSLLKKLEANTSFVHGLIYNRQNLQQDMKKEAKSASLKELNALRENSNISIICKGIETKEEEKFTTSCKIDAVQGYLYGRPVPFDLFQKKYMNHIFLF